MIKLAPSLLSADFSKLSKEILKIEQAGAHYLHIDVMDGFFVPNISVGMPVIQSIRKTTEMIFDVHLMIRDPRRYLKSFAEAGADILNVHIEACENILDTVHFIRSLNKRSAVTIKPDTPAEILWPIISEVDMILIMSVEPGFGGQLLIPETLKKAERIADFIAKKNLSVEMEMDGGITLDNVKDVLNVGVNVVVAGSAVFGTSNAGEAVKKFYTIFESFA